VVGEAERMTDGAGAITETVGGSTRKVTVYLVGGHKICWETTVAHEQVITDLCGDGLWYLVADSTGRMTSIFAKDKVAAFDVLESSGDHVVDTNKMVDA